MQESASIAIREMRPEDAAAVAGLTTQLGYPATHDDIRRRYELIKDRPDARVFAAERANIGICGWVHVQLTYLLECDARAEIWGLVVAESVRGSGVGRRLVEAAEDWAAARGVSVMALRSNQLRTGARQFYEHLGYTITKTQNAFRKNLCTR